jgi:hypothetical protein
MEFGNGDAQSADVGRGMYAVTSVSDDAKRGEALFKRVFGEPVGWPIAIGPQFYDLHDLRDAVDRRACAEFEGEDSEDEELSVLHDVVAEPPLLAADSEDIAQAAGIIAK